MANDPNLPIEQTSYGILPTPPSPTQTSPTLTQSTSNSASNSSSSPPGPTTPPRQSRSRTRYGDVGRVPLHRRGTSKTYERLEDLLKEAGYKETRVFTPEGERAEEHGGTRKSNDHSNNRISGMSAVVGFLAGLMPNNATNSHSRPASLVRTSSGDATVVPTRGYSPPPSPSPFLHHRPHTPTTDMTSSIESLGEPTPRPTRRPPSRSSTPQQHHRPQLAHRTSNNNTQAPPHVNSTFHRQLPHQPSHTSLHHLLPPSPHPPPQIAHPRPSRAGAYLRHMASASSIPQRPSSTPVRRSTDSDGGEEHAEPPLPPTWLESVARAVLFGGSGAYVGGPHAHPHLSLVDNSGKHHHHQHHQNQQQRTLRTTRSSLSQVSTKRPLKAQRSGLSDHTNTNTHSTFLAPPPLFAQLERGRAGRSEGEVSKTRVVCRSAPGSRAGSLVREREEKPKTRFRGKRKSVDLVPSLTKTQTEGDSWVTGASSRGRKGGDRYLGAWGAGLDDDDEQQQEQGDGMGGLSSEEEDDGELDLARILVHPKRQNSIRSLRKHLHQALSDSAGVSNPHLAGAAAGRGMNVGRLSHRPATTAEDWDGEGRSRVEEAWSEWVRKGVRAGGGGEDDDDDEFVGFPTRGSERSGSGKSRLGIPAWGNR
jgi:hypothetical protein